MTMGATTATSAPDAIAFGSILVALDESSRAPLVFHTAAALARSLGAELHLMRVVSLPVEIPAAAHSRPDHLLELVTRETRAALETYMAEAPDVRFRPPIVAQGDPWRSILDAARALDVDLVVVGSHRYHGLDHVLGTTAAKVVNHAGRNVFVVHGRPSPSPSPSPAVARE